ncbi:MAG: hypothetical protein GY845_15795 [Planctomycetes bacterium]|nr:hypothetical protein [Planctomycetota bacterium]
MENNDLINIWKEGNQEILKDRRFERSELEAFLKPKINKAAFSLNYNIVAYMAAQLAAMALIGFDLYGYRSNPVMLKVLIPMFIACSSFFGYGVFLLSYIWQINHGDFDLVTSINRKLKVYRRHYEAWMWMGAVSTLFLSFALSTWVDNDQGTYRINRPVFFAVVCFLVLIFIYGIQKIAQLKVVREIRIYLADIQNEALEGSHHIEQAKRKYLVVCVILTIIFTIFFILGIIKAMST